MRGATTCGREFHRLNHPAVGGKRVLSDDGTRLEIDMVWLL